MDYLRTYYLAIRMVFKSLWNIYLPLGKRKISELLPRSPSYLVMEGSGIVLGLSDKNLTITTNHDLKAKLTNVEKEQSVDQEDGRYQSQERSGRDDIVACEGEERGAPSNRSKRSDIGRAEWR